ncbi:LPS export ABC transporter periplasmic protein LptC [Carboxylicivirga sediminis]|uniref:LPS export ABC transporter periplasmic protein LptC n=1 Tax=Carboxylicivirga sediminis TaxID=2006564 RepID=A0A941F0C6_9BACT|nr:LPS export ABC transporter periplasmic protein LptC [Carboxylicivirga sediminis]MBR8534227.1 LPS export ABC transporter periplasmic protein LptC [Carboxylicivirga sediminis]
MIPLFKKNRIQSIQTASSAVLLAVYFLLSACQSNKPEAIAAITNREDIPSLIVEELETTITDSGKVKIKFITPEMLQYDRKKEPYRDFPKGLHCIMYQSNGEIDAQIKCRNAIYYDKEELWELNIDVEAINQKGEVLSTEQLFWDMKTEKIYSEKFVTITQGPNVYTGTGFEADQNMDNWRIKNLTGDLELEE